MSQHNGKKRGASRFLGQSVMKSNKGDQFKEQWKEAPCRHEKGARRMWNKLWNFSCTIKLKIILLSRPSLPLEVRNNT